MSRDGPDGQCIEPEGSRERILKDSALPSTGRSDRLQIASCQSTNQRLNARHVESDPMRPVPARNRLSLKPNGLRHPQIELPEQASPGLGAEGHRADDLRQTVRFRNMKPGIFNHDLRQRDPLALLAGGVPLDTDSGPDVLHIPSSTLVSSKIYLRRVHLHGSHVHGPPENQ